jgi:hypothetical protein
MARRGYKQHCYSGKYVPKNRHKYRGDINNIVWRSSWELRFLKYLDTNDAVIEYASEEIVVPYISPIDNKPHRYYVDFFVKMKRPDGTIKQYLVEVKPAAQTIQPKKPKRITESYIQAVNTYLVNKAKWKAAELFCEKYGLEFMVLTEYQLFDKR